MTRPDDDPFHLRRFLDAQEPWIDHALTELAAGRKTRHWMRFVFPQAEGLGSSPTARRYAIRSLDEARAYLADPLLGSRLLAAVEALRIGGEGPPRRSAREILGTPDDLKLRSSMTLFASVAEDRTPFQAVLEAFYGGEPDPRTEAILAAWRAGAP